eukprot:7144558-Alexandrium_andersonii.AAC.1
MSSTVPARGLSASVRWRPKWRTPNTSDGAYHAGHRWGFCHRKVAGQCFGMNRGTRPPTPEK